MGCMPVTASTSQSATSSQSLFGSRSPHKASGTASLVKLLPFNSMSHRRGKVPISAGISPVNLLSEIWSFFKSDRRPKDVLIVPENWQRDSTSVCKLTSPWYRSSGIVPPIFALRNDRCWRLDNIATSDWRVPLKLVPSRCNHLQLVNRLIVDGRVPMICCYNARERLARTPSCMLSSYHNIQ